MKKKTPNAERSALTFHVTRDMNAPFQFDVRRSMFSRFMHSSSLNAIGSAAYKEFLHIYRDPPTPKLRRD